MSEKGVRAELQRLMAANVGNWVYAFRRPLEIPAKPRAGKRDGVQADCSFGCKILCKWAGAPDPTGAGYDGWGNSSSMYHHLPHIPQTRIKVGDAAVFGHHDGEQHAVLIYKTGKDPVCWSHGGAGGPRLVPLSAEIAAHPGATVTFLRTVPTDPPVKKPPKKPAPVKTPPEREPTPPAAPVTPPAPALPAWYRVAVESAPLWAWMAWRDHGAPVDLRPPHVPARVPLRWWIRYRLHKGGPR